jgi:hypothetical protein
MAVIQAQAASALTTVDFIMTVGCYPPSAEDGATSTTDQGAVELKYVSFKYSKNVPATAPNGTLLGGNVVENRSLTVPFLAILPIPNLEVSTFVVLSMDSSDRLPESRRQRMNT